MFMLVLYAKEGSGSRYLVSQEQKKDAPESAPEDRRGPKDEPPDVYRHKQICLAKASSDARSNGNLFL